MKIQQITSQHRRDFQAIYVCEHCGATKNGSGYDDANFHNNVIPNMKCSVCDEVSPKDYRGLSTKYPEGAVV